MASTVKSEVEKFNTQALFRFSRSLNQLSDVVLKMASEVDQLTVHFPIWHQEIEDIIVLKNNKGTEDNRVRKLDYSIQLSKIFYERFIQDGEISLFSPMTYQVYMTLLVLIGSMTYMWEYERDDSIPRKTLGAQKLILDLLKERARDWSYLHHEHRPL